MMSGHEGDKSVNDMQLVKHKYIAKDGRVPTNSAFTPLRSAAVVIPQ